MNSSVITFKTKAKKEIEEITEEYSPIILPPDRFPTLREVEEYLFSEAMQRSEGNQSIAARLLESLSQLSAMPVSAERRVTI